MNTRLVFVLGSVTVVFMGALFLIRSKSATFRVENYWPEIRAAASEQGFEPSLLAAIVYVESRGNPRAVSSSEALGLMQLKAEAAVDAAKWIQSPPPDREDLFDPQLNLRLGSAYLRILLERFQGDLELAIMAYFAGPGTIQNKIEESGGPEKMKTRLAQQAGSAGEYLAQVLDFQARFLERTPQ